MKSLAGKLLSAEQSELETWKTNEKYSAYFFDQLTLLRRAINLEKAVQHERTVALAYAELLIKMLALKSWSFGRTKDPLPADFPAEVRRRAVDKFVYSSGDGK